MRIGVLSFYSPNINGHGGEKRSYQIRKLFVDANFCELFHFKEPNNIWQRIIFCIPTIASMKLLILQRRSSSFKSFIRDTRRINCFIYINKNEIKKLDLVIWESNISDNFFISYLLKNYFKVRVFAFPHNLESLVYYKTEKNSLYKFEPLKLELWSLNFCDRIFVISREENWLLRLFSIDSIYLPFYIEGGFKKKPTKYIKEILLIGSVNNPPTGVGMREVIEYFGDNITRFKGLNLHVAGFGTEIFKKYETDRIHVHGSILNLEELLIKIDVILINQMCSSGALTKIVEFSSMDFNIICNVESKRSFFDFDNVFEFNNLNEIPLIIDEINSFKTKKNGIQRVLIDIEYAKEKIKN